MKVTFFPEKGLAMKNKKRRSPLENAFTNLSAGEADPKPLNLIHLDCCLQCFLLVFRNNEFEDTVIVFRSNLCNVYVFRH